MFDLSPVRKLLRGSGKRRTTKPPVRSRPRPAGARLSLDSLEDRNLLSAGFAPPVSFATGAGPGSVIVADFNADGVPDLLTANSLDASVSVLLGNGDGSFQATRSFAAGRGPRTSMGPWTSYGTNWSNPHVFIQLLATDAKGKTAEWSIEMSSPEHLSRSGWKHGTLKPGDKATIVIHPTRDGSKGGQYLAGAGPKGLLPGSPPVAKAS